MKLKQNIKELVAAKMLVADFIKSLGVVSKRDNENEINELTTELKGLLAQQNGDATKCINVVNFLAKNKNLHNLDNNDLTTAESAFTRSFTEKMNANRQTFAASSPAKTHKRSIADDEVISPKVARDANDNTPKSTISDIQDAQVSRKHDEMRFSKVDILKAKLFNAFASVKSAGNTVLSFGYDLAMVSVACCVLAYDWAAENKQINSAASAVSSAYGWANENKYKLLAGAATVATLGAGLAFEYKNGFKHSSAAIEKATDGAKFVWNTQAAESVKGAFGSAFEAAKSKSPEAVKSFCAMIAEKGSELIAKVR